MVGSYQLYQITGFRRRRFWRRFDRMTVYVAKMREEGYEYKGGGEFESGH